MEMSYYSDITQCREAKSDLVAAEESCIITLLLVGTSVTVKCFLHEVFAGNVLVLGEKSRKILQKIESGKLRPRTVTQSGLSHTASLLHRCCRACHLIVLVDPT